MILRKWWVTLIQGVLMIIIGIFIFENPEELLSGISLWFGLLTTVTGLAGVLGYMVTKNEKSEMPSLIWSVATTVFGLLILMNLFAAMKAIAIIFGIWVIINGALLISLGWPVRKRHIAGWLLTAAGTISLIAGIIMVFNITAGAKGIALLLGLQAIVSGIALILFALAKKVLVARVKTKVSTLIQKAGEN